MRGVDDLPSEVCEFPYLNPVTGPIARRGRRARRHPRRALRRDRAGPRLGACRATFPHFGALTATHTTAMLHAAAGGAGLGLRDRPAPPAPAASAPAAADFTVELPLDPMHGTVGVAPAAGEVLMTHHARPRTAATWTPRSCAPASRRTSAVNVPGGHAVPRRRARPAGRGRGVRHGGRGGDEHRRRRRPDQGRRARPWPRMESDDFLMTTGSRPAAGGRLPDQPARPRRLDRRR